MATNKRKIVCIIPTMFQGGAERVMSILVNEWANDNEVYLILLQDNNYFYSIKSNVIKQSLNFENGNVLQKIFSEIKIFYKLRKQLKAIGPEFVLSFMTKCNILAILSTRFLNFRVFISDRSNPLKRLPLLQNNLKRILYPLSHGIITQTSFAKGIIQKQIKHKNIMIIPNPLKVINEYDVRRENIILNIGRLIPQKGQAYLLDAFSRLNLRDWKLVVLGEGPLRNVLMRKCEELKIDDKVEFCGTVKNVDEWMAKSSIFCLSSVSEGFPNSLIEAMAAGLPCISFDCPAGPSDIIIDGKNGFLVPVGDLNRFSEKINLLVKNESLRKIIGEEAKNVRHLYNSKKISDLFYKFCIKNP